MDVKTFKKRYGTSPFISVDVDIDLRDHVPAMGGPDAMTKEQLLALQDRLDAARRCLNRPERSPYQAIIHIEDAMDDIARALR